MAPSRFLIIPGFLVLAALAGGAPSQFAWSDSANPGVEAPRTYVSSLRDFVRAMNSHRDRVEAIGMDIREKFPEFHDVDPKLLAARLQLHDSRKMADWWQPRSLARRLYRFYGKDVKTLDQQKQEEAKASIRELNSGEKADVMEFYKTHHLLTEEGKPNAVAEKMDRIDLSADQVDRVMARSSEEEFGKIMEPASTSGWLKDPQAKKITAYYEQPQLDAKGTLLRDASGRPILDRSRYEGLFKISKNVETESMPILRYKISAKLRPDVDYKITKTPLGEDIEFTEPIATLLKKGLITATRVGSETALPAAEASALVAKLATAARGFVKIAGVAGLAYTIYDLNKAGKDAQEKGYGYTDGVVSRMVEGASYGLVPGYIETEQVVAGAMVNLGMSKDLEGSYLWNATHSQQDEIDARRRAMQLQMGRMMYGPDYQLPSSAAPAR